MTRSKKSAILWSLAGLLMLASGFFSEPMRLWPLISGVLFLAVALMTARRSDDAPPDESADA